MAIRSTPQVKWLFRWLSFFPCLLFSPPADAAINIPITVNLSETVDVTGTPRIPVDVGGTTRYASYTSGTGTNTLTFTLAPQAGDVDLDGVTVSSPIDLNGGAIKDTKGNDATLTFTPPNTTNVKVNYPSLSMDFIADSDGRYTFNGTVYNDLTSFLSATAGSFTRTGTSQATYFNSSGVMLTAVTNTPRFDYDPITHQPKGILIEESRTNLIQRSGEINNIIWTKTGSTINPDIIAAPSGNITADKIIESLGGTFHNIIQSVNLASNTLYTVSIFAKAAERNWIRLQADDGGTNAAFTNFDLSSGVKGASGTAGIATLVSSSISNVGNGWYRCTITYNLTSSITSRIIYTLRNSDGTNTSSYSGDGSSGVYFWGAQVEQGSFPTSYISTSNAAVTRGADDLIFPIPLSPSIGTILSKGSFDFLGTSSHKAFVGIDDNTSSNALQLRTLNSGLIGYGTVLSGQSSSHNFGSYTNGSLAKIAAAYQTNNSNGSVNGTLGAVNSSITFPSFSKLRIGGSIISGSGRLGGWIHEIKFYPSRVIDLQLQLLTQ